VVKRESKFTQGVKKIHTLGTISLELKMRAGQKAIRSTFLEIRNVRSDQIMCGEKKAGKEQKIIND